MILVVDDDQTLTALLSDHLRSAGYGVEIANDGEAGLASISHKVPELIILDVMMPRMDGWQVLEQVQNRNHIPVIMLTAKDQEFDKLRGFRLGVDDYVTKPFSFAELTARVGAVLARAARGSADGSGIVSGNLEIDFVRRRVRREGGTIDLTPTEYRVLEVLARHLDIPVPSEELVRRVWGSSHSGEVEHVKHYIWSLRRKLEQDPGDPKHLITERGFGYRLI